MYLFLNFPAQWTSIGRGNRRWRQRLNLSSLESLFSLSELIKVLETKENNWWRFLIFLPQELHSRSDLSSQYFTGKPTLSHSFARITPKGPSALRAETSSRFHMTGLRSKFDFKWTTTQTTVVSHRRRKRFSSSADFLFRSELRDRRHNTGFWRKEHRVSTFPAKI